ncbi:MAG: VWA domain-containing protein [Candidatus Promineifilaceae bacterium]
MRTKITRSLRLLALLAVLPAAACNGEDRPPRNAAVVELTANTSLGRWLEPLVSEYNDSRPETPAGERIYVDLSLADSGAAAAAIIAGEAAPDLWLPEMAVWAEVAADQGAADYRADCQSVARSPLVIAMWRPFAEALGWPAAELGWLDIGSLAADPGAWSYYTGAEGDSLRLGQTHPGLSGSGAATLLALVHAAEGRVQAVSSEQINQPIVQASVAAFESPVAWFSPDTAGLAQTMAERGQGYLGAAVMYESNAIANSPDIVPIYPFEGTFIADHPACLSAVSQGEEREAALAFRQHLLAEEAQAAASAAGLRTAAGGAAAAELPNGQNVDLSQPAVVFDPPSVEAIYAVQELWQTARKDVNLVMLLDVSGSMEGDKIENAREAAAEFVRQMGDEDYLSLVAFNHELFLLSDRQQVGPARDQLVATIEGLEAGGDTFLYDAIGYGSELIAQAGLPDAANALVILSDGEDTGSERHSFNQELIDLAAGNDTAVFVIAYGDDADEEDLSDIALGANGNFFLGDEASIAAIYEDMSAAFGGTVGVGR